MKKVFLIFGTIGLLSFSLYGQTSKLYVPLNIQNAIKKETRSNDGKPGKNYWQNKSDYKITAELFPDSSYLIGDETITYYNNSPDSLNEIVVRLYQDIAKYGSTRDWSFKKEWLNNGVKINYISIDDYKLDLTSQSNDIYRDATNLIINLKRKMAPAGTIELKIGWEFEIPKLVKLRMGNYGAGNLYVAYWYPQVAVYDDIDGWDKLDYSGKVEFYNDFSNYDVSIKVPRGMVVWATGELQNGEKVFRKDIFEKYEKAQQSDETINIITQEDYSKGIVTADNKFNEWHFKSNNVTDFTFATSKSFNWDGASVVVEESTERRVLTDVIYEDGTIYYDEAAQYARATIEYLSSEIPGFPYPYSHATTYCNGNSGGGMESPMMANNGAPSILASHIGLVFHEISHNYFPFIMGTNERKYAWMDEGWAAFLPTDIVNKYDPDFDYRKRRVSSYANRAGEETDLPLVIPSYSYKTKSARLGFYDRPANAYYALNELLGDELFKKGLLEYMSRWIGKHPLPQDFFFTFNDVVGEDLTWFWKPWFFEFGYPDLALTNVEAEVDFVSVTVKKVGNIPTRVEVLFKFEDGEKKTIIKSASVWKNNKDELQIKFENHQKLKSIILGNKYIPDAVKSNNIIEFNN
jgi:Peptidase family M1 domain